MLLSDQFLADLFGNGGAGRLARRFWAPVKRNGRCSRGMSIRPHSAHPFATLALYAPGPSQADPGTARAPRRPDRFKSWCSAAREGPGAFRAPPPPPSSPFPNATRTHRRLCPIPAPDPERSGSKRPAGRLSRLQPFAFPPAATHPRPLNPSLSRLSQGALAERFAASEASSSEAAYYLKSSRSLAGRASAASGIHAFNGARCAAWGAGEPGERGDASPGAGPGLRPAALPAAQRDPGGPSARATGPLASPRLFPQPRSPARPAACRSQHCRRRTRSSPATTPTPATGR